MLTAISMSAIATNGVVPGKMALFSHYYFSHYWLLVYYIVIIMAVTLSTFI